MNGRFYLSIANQIAILLNKMEETMTSTASQPLLNRETLMACLGSRPKWMILKKLCEGEALSAGEVAALLDCGTSGASKHMRDLIEAGLCLQRPNRTYRLVPRFQPALGTLPEIDFGHCLVRFHTEKPAG